jgi:hypothetical protein
MQLPGPVRAAVGLVASAADNAKHLPDRAIELPMLAVSTALQVSLRAQQRYARLTARGDEALSRRKTGDEPPEWATFDDPLPSDELHSRRSPGVPSREAARLLDELFGESSDDAASGPATNGTEPAADATSTLSAPAPAAAPAPAPAKRAAAKKAPAKKAAARKPAAKRTNTARANGTPGKGVSKPRHTAPSRFDAVGDAADGDNADDTDSD